MTDGKTKQGFFGAINSSRGFVSFFEEIFFSERIEKRYIIKGGPGTGKSSLMRRIAASAESSGRDVEYYYCSSDTDSLDGIVIDGRAAIFDGTAPHSYDTRLPGVSDELINLGQYWNAEMLVSHRRDIAELSRRKSAAYERAYAHLAAAGGVRALADDLILPLIKREKLEGAVRRAIKPCGGEGHLYTRQTSAAGVRGQVHLDTLAEMAEVRVAIDDFYGTASIYLAELCRQALSAGHGVYVSYDTLIPSKISEIYLPRTGEYFGVYAPSESDRVINMKRFVEQSGIGEIRARYRSILQSAESTARGAYEYLARAGEYHAAIEKYYVLAMDFDYMREELSRVKFF